LQNNLNRWYDAKSGRWVSEDPIGFAAGLTNLSGYVGNAPTAFTDPSGLWQLPAGPQPAPTAGPQPAAPATKPFDKSKFPEERRSISARDFPRLGDEYEVLAPATRGYNCIAHTGDWRDKLWVNPYQDIRIWDALYRGGGYTRADNLNTAPESGKQKVVLYGTASGGSTNYTHAAIQSKDGGYESKLGEGPLIRHKDADSVAGGLYGRPVAVYERKSPW
jgi:type VI secretion system secreted protein VgrG